MLNDHRGDLAQLGTDHALDGVYETDLRGMKLRNTDPWTPYDAASLRADKAAFWLTWGPLALALLGLVAFRGCV